MSRQNIQTVLKDAVIGFMPGAFLTIALIVVIPAFRSPHSIENLRSNWWLVLLELFLLTVGFAAAASLLTSGGLKLKRWRAAISGPVAVILLGVISIFTQGARLGTIIVASLLAGMLSTLTAVHGSRRVVDQPDSTTL